MQNFPKKSTDFSFFNPSPPFFLFSFPKDRSCIGEVAWPKHQGLVHSLKKGEGESGSGGVTLCGKQTSIAGAFKPFSPERRNCYVQKGQERLTLFHFCQMTSWSLFGEEVHAEHHYHKPIPFLTGEGEAAGFGQELPFSGFAGYMVCSSHHGW